MDDTITSDAPRDISYGALRRLANTATKPSTPTRRASSAGPPSTHRSTRASPAIQIRTPGALQRLGGSGKRNNALTTPHGRAAMREIEARRAGFTPGKERRRSGREQRETPRDVLRLLSRTLAPQTQLVVPTPPGANKTPRKVTLLPLPEDLDEGPDLEKPRLSLPLDEDEEEEEDDSLILSAPRSAGLEDENFTVQSIELPRRAVSEQPGGRFSRPSFGSIRISDGFPDLNEMGFGGDAVDSSFVTGGAFQDGDIPDMTDMSVLPGDYTGTIRDLDERHGQSSPRTDRISPIRSIAGDDREFVFTFPQQDEVDRQQEGSIEPVNKFGFELEDDQDRLQRAENEEDDYDDGEVQMPSSPHRVEASMEHSTTIQSIQPIDSEEIRTVKKKKLKISKYGIQYPSLPLGVVKKLATKFARTGGNKSKISKDTLDAILQASDWFFEQVGDDLAAYSKHAGRKTIDESDVLTLMKRFATPSHYYGDYILIHFIHFQTTTNKYNSNSVLFSPEISAWGASSRVANGATIKNQTATGG